MLTKQRIIVNKVKQTLFFIFIKQYLNNYFRKIKSAIQMKTIKKSFKPCRFDWKRFQIAYFVVMKNRTIFVCAKRELKSDLHCGEQRIKKKKQIGVITHGRTTQCTYTLSKLSTHLRTLQAINPPLHNRI